MKYYLRRILLISVLTGIISGCHYFEKPRAISITWANEKAVAITIPRMLLKEGDIKDSLQVRLIKNGERQPVLGTFAEAEDEYTFAPIIPFTFGLRYEVLMGKRFIGEIEIPPSEAERPRLVTAFPSQDTVPENLLKIHLQFSRPMSEGRSMTYLTLIRNYNDTVQGTFLDLQPELWNEDGTELTLWLDPGRIKLDLIPNKELGNPLQGGARYSLDISSEWRSKDGIPMNSIRAMDFYVGARDDQSPDPDHWKITLPGPGTYDALEIDVGEALDYSVMRNAISILDAGQRTIAGKIQIAREEHLFQFLPAEPWKVGSYRLQVEGRLEDLSGNNLNRLFEEDLLKSGEKKEVKEVFEQKFEIH